MFNYLKMTATEQTEASASLMKRQNLNTFLL